MSIGISVLTNSKFFGGDKNNIFCDWADAGGRIAQATNHS